MENSPQRSGQKRGLCNHFMARFDPHGHCARCRDKSLGDDPCVLKLQCPACENLTEAQKNQLATPSYRVRRDRSGSSPRPSSAEPTSSLGSAQKGKAKKTKTSTSPSSGQASAGISARGFPPGDPTVPSTQVSKSDLLALGSSMEDKWDFRFHEMEAHLMSTLVVYYPSTPGTGRYFLECIPGSFGRQTRSLCASQVGSFLPGRDFSVESGR